MPVDVKVRENPEAEVAVHDIGGTVHADGSVPGAFQKNFPLIFPGAGTTTVASALKHDDKMTIPIRVTSAITKYFSSDLIFLSPIAI